MFFWFFGCEACGILAPWPGIEPAPPALEGEVLTAGPPEKSLFFLVLTRTWNLSPEQILSVQDIVNDCRYHAGQQISRV